MKVIGKKKNVVINGILEAYLRAYPHKRPEPKQTDRGAVTSNEGHQVGPDGMYLDHAFHDDDDEDDEEMDEDDEVSDWLSTSRDAVSVH